MKAKLTDKEKAEREEALKRLRPDDYQRALNDEVYDAAREFTEQKDLEDNPVTEEDIRFVLSVIKKAAPCDETAIKQLWYGMNSGLTKCPLPHNVNSRVAERASHMI